MFEDIQRRQVDLQTETKYGAIIRINKYKVGYR